MIQKIDYNSWSTEEIQRQIQKLSSVSDLTFRCIHFLVELGDGHIRVSTIRDDKSWSDWETIETPNLHVTDGKVIVTDNNFIAIRVSSDQAYELCSTKDDPWTNDDATNCFNPNMSGTVLGYILTNDHRDNAAKLLTTRTTIPGTPFQTGLSMQMIKDIPGFIRKTNEERLAVADNEFRTGGYVKFFRYENSDTYWTPLQEVAYLKEVLKSRNEQNNKESLQSKTPDEVSESLENTNKDYKIAALLAIFTGGFGLHKFYMGKYMIGAIYLIFCWTWIPGVIGIIEGIKYLLDSQEKFLEKLND